MDYDSSDEDTDPLAQRRRLVKQWHSLGESMAKTARILGVTVRQVEHDYKVLGLQCFSDASDAETSARERSYGDRFGSSRVRANAASCVARLARAAARLREPG